MARDPRKYIVGIDVGTHSLGTAAIEVDDVGMPIQILGARVLIHDSGLDPEQMKSATTRLASSGVARRTRRMLRRRRRRFRTLDELLGSWGWPVTTESDDPYAPWRARATLASGFVSDPVERQRLLSIAVRHIARHRGWRSPYMRVESLLTRSDPSEFLVGLRERLEASVHRSLPPDATPGQLVAACALSPDVKLRGGSGLLGGRLHQSDNAMELQVIADTQQLSDDERRQLILAVFAAEKPKGAQAGRIGRDPLPGQHGPRASKASDAFQRYRIACVIANLRVKEAGSSRILTPAERKQVFDYLINTKTTGQPTWLDVAKALSIPRQALSGTASTTEEGDRVAARPPVHATDRLMRTSGVDPLAAWWPAASTEAHEAMIEELSNSAITSEDSPGGVEARQVLEEMSEADLGKLDSLHLPAGRAAYCADSLRRLTQRMLDEGLDLHGARMAEFGVAPDWEPPAEPIGKPVGSPAVDRVLKATARWLGAAESEWGKPQRITIEHVRSAFMSEDGARRYDRDNDRRYQQRRARVEEVKVATGSGGELRRSDVLRFEAITRQNGQCLYCGEPITFLTAQMDHILPRAGQGSTNNQFNLAASCARCNKAKGKTPFATWAKACQISGVSVEAAVERTRHWTRPPGLSVRQFNKFLSDVRDRLDRTELDPEIDARSLESVAWMANELAHRIRQHFKAAGADVGVQVYRGALTAEARKASGIEGTLPLVGARQDDAKKSRLDRRHHAVDAAVVAMIDPSVARTLAERDSMRFSQRLCGEAETWKQYQGHGTAEARFTTWRLGMEALASSLAESIRGDQIPVMESLRLRLANGAGHDDTVKELECRRLADELPAELIDRAETPALWVALTRAKGYDAWSGLSADPDRSIRVHGTCYGPADKIKFFRGKSAAIAVRGGYAEIGSTIHHARIYRVEGSKPAYGMLRVFAVDLLRHRHVDLFSAELPPQAISVRTADPKVRRALTDGTAQYLGWLVTGDELLIDMTPFGSGQIGEFLTEFPGTQRWRLEGFESPTNLRLRPAQLAAEGLSTDTSDPVRKILDRPGWRAAVNQVFGPGLARVIRRDALGRVRDASPAGLPVSWGGSCRADE